MSAKLLFAVAAFVFTVVAFADGKATAKKLNLEASGRASKQWERVFGSPEKLREIGADKLSIQEIAELKKYLIDHAADSDHPSVPGK